MSNCSLAERTRSASAHTRTFKKGESRTTPRTFPAIMLPLMKKSTLAYWHHPFAKDAVGCIVVVVVIVAAVAVVSAPFSWHALVRFLFCLCFSLWIRLSLLKLPLSFSRSWKGALKHEGTYVCACVCIKWMQKTALLYTLAMLICVICAQVLVAALLRLLFYLSHFSN